MTPFIYGCLSGLTLIIGFFLGRLYTVQKFKEQFNQVQNNFNLLKELERKKNAEFALREEILRFKEKESSHCD